MGSKFGHDFSHVQLHTSPSAASSAEAIGARAYTVGSDIVFGPGRYAPGTAAGQHLLAHELTHVVQQSNGGSGALSHTQYGQAEGEARAAASLAGPATVSQTVATGTVQADDDWFDIATSAVLGPITGPIAAQAIPDAGSWILGAIGGEFTDNPTYGQIGVDFVLSVIPYVDQVADARDIIAHIYRLGFRGEYTKVLRWIALVFTLIGLVPEIGSVVKSLSKAAIRFVGRNLGTVMGWVRRLADLLPQAARGMDGVRRFIASHWDSWARFGRAIWDTLLSKGGDLVDLITTKMRAVLSVPGFLISQGKRFLIDRLNDLRRISATKLPTVIKNVKDQVLNKLDDLAEHLRPRTATAGGPDVSGRAEPLQMSATGGGGGRTTTTTVEELRPRGSGTTQEDIAEVMAEEIGERVGASGQRIGTETRVAEGIGHELSPQQFVGRYRDRLISIQRHHSFFSYLLRATQRSRGVRKVPRHGRLTPLTEVQHRAIHDLFDIAHPNLAGRQGATRQITEMIERGEISPAQIADSLIAFYRRVASESPNLLPANELAQIERVIASIRRRGGI